MTGKLPAVERIVMDTEEAINNVSQSEQHGLIISGLKAQAYDLIKNVLEIEP